MPEAVLAWIDAGRPVPVPHEVEEWTQTAGDPELLDELARLWVLSEAPAPKSGGLDDLRLRMLDEAPVRRRWPTWQRIAASIALIGVGFSSAWLGLTKVGDPGALQQVIVPVASAAQVELPGDIVVDLNAESRLAYRVSNGRVTDVELEGEGFFQVPHDPNREFIVRTAAGVVRDLGTDFNIRVRNGELAVAVSSGVVALENEGHSVKVRAGQFARARTGTPPTAAEVAAVSDLIAWTSGELVFVDQSMQHIAEELARSYGVSITVAPSLADTRITARVRAATELVDALRAVTLPAGARYSRNPSGWEITP